MTIGDYVKKGGKLPGEKGFDANAIQKDVDKRKKEKEAATQQKAVVQPSPVKPTFEQNEFIPNKEQPQGFSQAEQPTQQPNILQKYFKTDQPLSNRTGMMVVGINPFTFGGTTATSTLAKIGTSGVTKTATSTASRIATNTATRAATASWLSKLATYAKNPAVIVTGLMGAIGSYPFSGFIKEEALQTLGFAVNTATRNGDIAGAELALKQQSEILDPTLWDEIINKIPYANILTNLKDFYSAARTKLAVDSQYVEDMKIQQATGETEDQKWARVNQQQADQEKANIDYYNEQRKQLIEWERQAAQEQRNADAKFWAKEREKQRQKEKEDREAIAKFWEEYRKKAAKAAEDNRPSKLNFGLI